MERYQLADFSIPTTILSIGNVNSFSSNPETGTHRKDCEPSVLLWSCFWEEMDTEKAELFFAR